MFIPLTIGIVSFSFFSKKFLKALGLTNVFIYSSVLSILIFVSLALQNDAPSVLFLLFALFFLDVSIGLFRPSIMTAIVEAIPENMLGMVNSLSSVLTNIGGSVGIALTSAIVKYYHYTKGTTNALFLAFDGVCYFSGCVFLLMVLITLFFLPRNTAPHNT